MSQYNELNIIIYQNYEYEVYGKRYRGPWLMVDGGYLPWSCTICPLKETEDIRLKRWSEWVESIRKGVEVNLLLLERYSHISYTHIHHILVAFTSQVCFWNFEGL